MTLFLYLFLFFSSISSLVNVFKNNALTMTETNTFIGNWKFKDITFKELIDLEFPLPQFNMSYGFFEISSP